MDSKMVATEAKREMLYEQLKSTPGVLFTSAVVDNREIDRINILNATMKAMTCAVQTLIPQLPSLTVSSTNMPKEHVLALIDGNRCPVALGSAARSIVKGDQLVLCIAAASIVAKVKRDRLMIEADALYPHFGFAKHKGYPTKAHFEVLQKHEPTPLHRLSFAPLREKYVQKS
mmetsp:Transcript_6740/g.18087  ORF Transcript_6740/g.18087 Transcript_6740/m.18087 type:complete len:173 (-) Transcript_6740:1445-1963(-)